MRRILPFLMLAMLPVSAHAFVATSHREEEPPRAAGCQFQVRESYDLWYCLTKPQYEQYLAEKQAAKDQRAADRAAFWSDFRGTWYGRIVCSALIALGFVAAAFFTVGLWPDNSDRLIADPLAFSVLLCFSVVIAEFVYAVWWIFTLWQ